MALIREKAKIKQDQAVCDDMTVTLGKRCNNLNNAVRMDVNMGQKQISTSKTYCCKNNAGYRYVRDIKGSRPNTQIPINNKMQ